MTGVEEEKQQVTAGMEAEDFAMFDLKIKRKKRKPGKSEKTDSKLKNDDDEDGEVAEATEVNQNGSSPAPDAINEDGIVDGQDPPTYEYSLLLSRVTEFVQSNNPDLCDKKRFMIKPPQLTRVGTKKTLWVNFQDICTAMRRNPEHVFQFITAELGAEGSIDGNQRLVIRGKFAQKYIESLVRKYITEYVVCPGCRSFRTLLVRDNASRLFFAECEDCSSTRSVAPIRAGFHAQTKADRKALRNAL